MTNTFFSALSEQDRVLLSQQARRFAAALALRYARPRSVAYDLYLVGLNALPDVLAKYRPGDTMGFFHAIERPLRSAIVRAAVEMRRVPEKTALPSTLQRALDTGHLM